MKTIVHVNQHKIKSNRKTCKRTPPLTVKTYKSNDYATEAIIMKDGVEMGRIVYRPDKPLSCGGVCWFETENCKVIIK